VVIKMGAFKDFKHEQNQTLWNQYFEYKQQQGTEQSKDPEKVKGSINQYKPSALALEKATDKRFTDITAQELDSYINSNIIKNTGHVRGFLITCINNGWLAVNKDVLAYLIPIEYKKLVELLIV